MGAVFVAAAMVATSVGITARVLGEMNLLSTRTSRLILAAALFMMLVAPRVVRQLQPKVEGLSTQNASLIFALSLCLFLSWLAAKIGMAAIVGGFLLG